MVKKIMTVCLVAGLVAVLFAAGSCDKLNKIPGNVSGQLLNEAGQGQGFIAVQLVDVESGKIVTSENANDNGNFMFAGVPGGTYIIKTMPIGGEELRNDCKEFKLLPGKTATVNVTVYFDKK